MQSEFDFACSETGVIDPTAKYLFAALLKREDCVILRELNALRERGWRSATIHSHFKQQRHVADYNKQEGVDMFWLDTMYKSLKSMDCVGRFVRAKRFLDIGCCPGGYSTYIMRTCPEATGMGISLPVESAGHGLAIPQDLLPRIDVVMQDLTNYDLAPRLRKPRAHLLTPIPFRPNSFDFVVCDGHHLRLNTDNIARPWNWTRLLIAQVLLGLRAVSAGGTMFVKLSNVERPLTARILLALYRMSNHVRTIKPRTIHATRGTFYALAQGVRTQSTEYRKLVDGLERLWYVMSFGGEEGYGRGITWEEQEEVTQWEEVMSSQGVLRIVRLGTKVWEIQRDALKGWLQWKGVDVTPNWRG